MIDIPYQEISFQETVCALEAARQQLREMTKEARRLFFQSWQQRNAECHQQMNALVEEAFALARQTIDGLPEDILKIASDQSMKMGTFYHTRGGMPPREYELYMYLGGARGDFQCRKGFAERNITRAKEALAPYLGNEAITWEQKKAHDGPLYIGWSTPLDYLNHIGDEFYVLTLILNKVPDYLKQSHEMMLEDFKEGDKKKRVRR